MQERIKIGKPSQVFREFTWSDNLVMGRFREYLPSTFMSSGSGILLNMVDTLVVGRLIGGNALAAVSLAAPFFVVIRMIIKMLSVGIGTNMSIYIGKNDESGMERCKRANRLIMLYGFVFILLSQVLIGWMIMTSYSITPDERAMVWTYMVFSMAGTPFYLVSSICNKNLQVYGRMKSITRLTLLEQVINLVGDIVLVRFAKMGIAGAGLATSVSQIVRACVTFGIVIRTTDMMKTKRVSCGKEIGSILKAGLPSGQSVGQNALQQWFLSLVMLNAVGMEGVAVKAVCSSCYNLMNIAIVAVSEAMRPVAGVMYGARDYRGGWLLLRDAMGIAFIGAALFELLFEAFPVQTLTLYGIAQPTARQISILQIYCSYFVLNAFIGPLQTHLTATRQSRQAAILTALNGVFVFAPAVLLLLALVGGHHIFWAYPINALAAAGYGLCVVRRELNRLKAESDPANDLIVYISLRPQDGMLLSERVEEYADQMGFGRMTAMKMGIVVEELTMTVKEKSPDARIDMILRQDQQENRLVLVSFDDGLPIRFNAEFKTGEAPDRLRMIALMSDSLRHQSIVGLNYLTMTFALDEPGA